MSGRTQRVGAVRAEVAVAVTAAMVMAAACGSGASGAPGRDRGSEPPSGSEPSSNVDAHIPTSTTQPSATEDEETAFEAVHDTFDRIHRLRNDLYQDPEMINTEDGAYYIERLRDLHSERLSYLVDELTAAIEELAADGHRLRPAGEVMADWGIYRLEATDADTITFEACVLGDSETVDEAGQVVDHDVFGAFGTGVVHRVDGVWRLHRMTQEPERYLDEHDRSPGALQSGFCDLEMGDRELGAR